MTRGVGVAEWLAGLPDPVVALAAVLTQLADLWFLTLVVATLYWLGPHAPRLGAAVDRRRLATVFALLLLGIALTGTLKAIFAVPRPPWAVAEPTLAGLPAALEAPYAWLAGADGYGFPSGHAIAVTVGWGGLAWAVRAGRRRTRVAVAGTVVLVVTLARLVLGVHFLVDVVAGALVGIAALALVIGMTRGSRREPATGFGLAVFVALVGVAVAGLTTDAAAAAGLAIGAALAWLGIGEEAVAITDGDSARLAAALGVVLVLPALGVAVVGPASPVATLAIALAAGAAVVALPLVGGRVAKKSRSRSA